MRAGGCEADSDEVGRDASPPEGRDIWGAHSTVDPAAAVEAEAEAAETAVPDRTGRPPEPGQQARKGPCTHTIPARIKASFPEGRYVWGVATLHGRLSGCGGGGGGRDGWSKLYRSATRRSARTRTTSTKKAMHTHHPSMCQGYMSEADSTQEKMRTPPSYAIIQLFL